jgi:hypothetical protein
MSQADLAAAPPARRVRSGAALLWRSHYALLLLCLIASIATQGMAPPSAGQRVVVTALAGAALLLAARAARMRPWFIRAAAALALAGVAVAVLRATSGAVGEGAARVTNVAVLAFGPPAVAIGVVRDVRGTGRVRVEAITGVLALYMLIGLLFAAIYYALDQVGGGPAFAGGVTATLAHCIYFSFTTLTTVGYGDVATSTDVGHTISVFEALIGQIYLVTVVSLLVGNLGQQRRAGG